MTMAMVDVDGSCQFSVDSQPKSTGLICGLAATLRSVCIHQMNRVNSRSDFGHDDSIINIVIAIINIIVIGLSVSMWVRAFSDRHFHISLPSTSSPVSAQAVLIRVHFCCLRVSSVPSQEIRAGKNVFKVACFVSSGMQFFSSPG